jgi:acyl-CoA synthetase (AMP-forming)/AMP-acid ligase II
MPGVEVRIVDPATLTDLPPGTRGEVWIGGGHVMRGYWHNPAATATTIVDGWVRTGDGGSFDGDGYLYLHDRIKDMIVSGGENVYPAEVESVLTGHPDLAEVAVVGVPSARWGESPVAVVVARTGHQPDEAEVIAWCRERLAHFKCPVAVHVVEALPRNASGKLLKHALRSTYAG